MLEREATKDSYQSILKQKDLVCTRDHPQSSSKSKMDHEWQPVSPSSHNQLSQSASKEEFEPKQRSIGSASSEVKPSNPYGDRHTYSPHPRSTRAKVPSRPMMLKWVVYTRLRRDSIDWPRAKVPRIRHGYLCLPPCVVCLWK